MINETNQNHTRNPAERRTPDKEPRRSSLRRRLGRTALATLCLGLPVTAFTASPASAVPGVLDTTFGTGGKVTTDIGAATADFGADTVVQPDGKIVVAGTTGDDFAVVRYNASGTLDTTFGTGGKVITDIGTTTVDSGTAVVLQADGKIVVAGTSADDFAVVRYSATGTLDTTFGTGGKVITDIGTATPDTATDVVIQPDGRIVVAGYALGTSFDFAAVRYSATGTLDTTFGTGGKVITDIGTATSDGALALALQPDGKIVAAGFTAADFALVRYSATGTLDTTFGTGGKVITDVGTGTTDYVNDLVVQPDGKIVATGFTSSGGGGDFAVVRYGANGSLDTTFNSTGKVVTDIGSSSFDLPSALTLQADGKIVVAGFTSSAAGDFAVVRYNPIGALDTTFNSTGKVVTDVGTTTSDNALGLALQPDGKIVVAGTSASDFAVVRYEGDPSVSISDASATEADFGTTIATFTVTLSAAPVAATTVAFATANGTATAPADYTAASGTLTFAIGETTKTISVAVRGDGLDEPNETFFVNLTSPTNISVVTDAQGVGTIIDDDEGPGYWLVATDGGIFAFDAPFSGSTGAQRLNQPIVGMAADPDGKGYWLVAADGGIFAFDAPFFGSTGALKLNKPIVGMAATPDGKGYYLVASDGGIFAFGPSAVFKGSTGALTLNKPVVGMAADPDGSGYYLVATDGGIFAFDAVFKGSTGALTLNKPIVGMTADPDGAGYFLVATDGGIFAFDAVFKGSTGALTLNKPVVGMAADPDGSGYWLVATDGGIFAFDAVFKGSTGALTLNKPVVGMAART